MIMKFILNNFQAFNSEVELDLEADLRTKKFMTNVALCEQGNTLKSAAIYGPNNTGKTCLINAIRAYRSVLLNNGIKLRPNLYSDSTVVKLGAEFLISGNRYSYHFSYDSKKKIFIEEEFAHIVLDQHGNLSKKEFFYRNTETKTADSTDDKLSASMRFSTKDNILINSLDTTELPLLAEAKEILLKFAKGISILSMQSIQPFKTIEMLKTPDTSEAKQIVDLIKNADLDIDDFRLDEKLSDAFSVEVDERDEKTKDFHNTEKVVEMLKLTSVHKGVSLPSIIFDSLGTKKIVSLASYLVSCLNSGGSLIIDELDSGIHFKLSRSIISLFNSALNKKGQLIFSTHDASLLDIKTLFRKEQLWFTDKDKEQVYLYSLSNFTAQNSGIRLESNLYDYYSKGLLGALPDPSLIDILLTSDGDDYE
ncbi:MAG: ATP-binding protein [Anaerovoracaceae bacterium]